MHEWTEYVLGCKCFLKAVSFIKCLFKLLLYNPVKPLFVLCCIKLSKTIFMAYTSCCGIAVRVWCHIFLWSEHIQHINRVFLFITLNIYIPDPYNLWDICTLPKTQMFNVCNQLLIILGVFQTMSHMSCLWSHMSRRFFWHRKNSQALFRDFWTYIRLTQKSCPKSVTRVTQLHDWFYRSTGKVKKHILY